MGSPLVALLDRLKFPNIFVPENEQTFVHLAKAIQEYRNIEFLIFILVDNFKRHDHSGWAKAGWTALLLFVPVIGALIYIIARPPMEPATA